MHSYKLSLKADQDFQSIFEFGLDRFGLEQALKYQFGLKNHLSDLAEHPLSYPAIDHIRKGYRRSVYRSHKIYYLVREKDIFIVRILGQQDESAHLPESE